MENGKWKIGRVPFGWMSTIESLRIRPFWLCLEPLPEFTKLTWHPSIFGKIGKIMLQQFGIQLGKF
jgi:hypothetical protein